MPDPNRRKYIRYKTVELIEAGESFLKENNIKELKEIQYEIGFRRRPYTARMLEDIKERIKLHLKNNRKRNNIPNEIETKDEIVKRENNSSVNTLKEIEEIELNKDYSSNEKIYIEDEKDEEEDKKILNNEVEEEMVSKESLIPEGFNSIKEYLQYKLENAKASDTSDYKEEEISDYETTENESNILRRFEHWAEQLVDLTGRNDLLCFRQTRNSSYIPSEEIVQSLLSGNSISVAELEELEAEGNIKGSVKEALENFDQFGIEVFSLISGFAIWESDLINNAYSPLLYYKLSINNPKERRIKNITFSIKNNEPEVNPALVLYLKRKLGEEINEDLLKIAQGESEEIVRAYLLEEISEDLHFRIEDGYAMKNLRYLKFPMVKDILSAGDALMNNILITALAGDEKSIRGLRDNVKEIDISEPDYTPPENEFLVLDADSSQQFAINAALKGQNLVIEGPPGTGKSQTITNLISSFIAQGKSVLFVAEKRPAIDAVKKRINKVGLEDYFLDLHSIDSFIKKPAESFRQQFEFITQYRKQYVPQNDDLTRSRDILVSRCDVMKDDKNIWNTSYKEVLNLAIQAKKDNDYAYQIDENEINNLNPKVFNNLENLLSELSSFSINIFANNEFPLRKSFLDSKIKTPNHIQKIISSIDNIKKNLIEVDSWISFQEDCDTNHKDSLEKIYQLESSIDEVLANDLLDLSKEYVLDKGKLDYLKFIFNKNIIFRWYSYLRDKEYKNNLSIFKKIINKGKTKNYENILKGLNILESKKNLDIKKIKIFKFEKDIFKEINTLNNNLNVLNQFLDEELDEKSNIEKLKKTISILLRHRDILPNIIKVNELLNSLLNLGLSENGLFEEILIDFENNIDDTKIFQRTALAWCESVEELLRINNPEIASFDRDYLDDVVEEFRENDQKHIENSFERISIILDNNASDALNDFPNEAQILRQELARSRRFKPARELFEKVSNVAKKLKPCWAMSPLVVSKVMPSNEPFFDVVIFDEASQIVPHDAITSILRGKQTIVAGDSKQLSPTSTAFFASGGDSNQSNDFDDEEFSAADETESLLEAVKQALPPVYGTKTLLWHYRSEDERLISFSNCHPELYNKKLITAPSVTSTPPFKYHLVTGEFKEISGVSPEAECRKTIELVINNLRDKPEESVAVIAFGIEHARRLRNEFSKQVGEESDLAEYPEDRPEEKFIIRHLENIQGDERDVIFLSTGYGPNSSNSLRQNFGPLNYDNPKLFGLRRLNVAITRARKRVEVISTIDPYKYDDNQLGQQVSKKAFIQYLRYVKSEGSDLGDLSINQVPMNPFEQDIYDSLVERGIGLVPQYGVSGYRLDFAVQHPEEKGRYVLALEADGASYHSSETARDRDRIRQSHLEKLGWKFHRIWSQRWFKNKEEEIEIALIAIKQAINSLK